MRLTKLILLVATVMLITVSCRDGLNLRRLTPQEIADTLSLDDMIDIYNRVVSDSGWGGAIDIGGREIRLNIDMEAFDEAMLLETLAQIGGSDDRQPMVASGATAISERGFSVFYLVDEDALYQHTGEDRYTLNYHNRIGPGGALEYCHDDKAGSDRFFGFPTFPGATCFAIKPDIIVTAAHKIREGTDITTKRLLHGFERCAGSPAFRTTFSTDQIYTPVEVLYRSLTSNMDIAIIRIAETLAPYQISNVSADDPHEGDPLYMIGHPLELPKILTDNGSVYDISPDRRLLRMKLDVFANNSGSPVFNARTNEIVGLTITGTGADSELIRRWGGKQCYRVVYCNQYHRFGDTDPLGIADRCYIPTAISARAIREAYQLATGEVYRPEDLSVARYPEQECP